MVGMNAVIMDNAVIGEESIVAALSFIKADMQVPARTLVAGVPGKAIRVLTQQEIDWKTTGTGLYQELAVKSLATLRPVAPLTSVEPDRKRFRAITGLDPLFALKRKTT
jgi:phenylacetic acid degradation protein